MPFAGDKLIQHIKPFLDKCRQLAKEQGVLFDRAFPNWAMKRLRQASHKLKIEFPFGKAFVYEDDWMAVVASTSSNALYILRKDLTKMFPGSYWLEGDVESVLVRETGSVWRCYADHVYLIDHVDEKLGLIHV